MRLAASVVLLTVAAHIYYAGPPYVENDVCNQAGYALVVQLLCTTSGMAVGGYSGSLRGRNWGALIGSLIGGVILLYLRLAGILVPQGYD
jgi:hypothetical protein